jgi:5-methylthioadenosine/S-adenosylhomocysteine deaminase
MITRFENASILSNDQLRTTTVDILVNGEVIQEITPAKPPTDDADANIVDCSGCLLTPGFVNGHIHPNQLLNRGFLDDVATEDLLANMHSRHDAKSDEMRYWASLISIAEALRCGTTFLGAFATSSGLIAKAMHDSGIRGCLTVAKKDQWWGSGAPPAQVATDSIMAGLEAEAERWHFPRIALSLGVASDRAATEALLIGIRRLSERLGLRVALHVAEGQSSVDLSIRYRGCRPVEYLDEIGFLDHAVTLIHACNVNEREIGLIARSGAGVCHCPISNAKSIAGTLPLKRIQSSGIPVCLGTDAASVGNTNNILIEAYFAALLHRVAGEDPTYPTAAQLVHILTTGGAQALGVHREIGQISPGFKADFSLWKLNQSGFLSNVDVPSHALIYCPSELQAFRVYIGGRLVFDEKPLGFDLDEALTRVAAYCRS